MYASIAPSFCELQSSLKVGDANVCMENHDCGDLSMADGKAEGVVNCLVRFLV